MNIPAIWKRASKAAADNAPTILTSIGVAGAITTAVLASRASFKSADIIKKEETKRCIGNDQCLSTQDKFKAVWPQYIPAAASAALTVAAIVCSNRISTKRAAALASAYTVSQEFIERYKDKVAKALGEDKEKEVHAEVSKEMRKSEPPQRLLVAGKGTLVHELYTDTWFTSSYEDLQQAEIDTNYQIIHDGYASLSDFFNRVDATHGSVAEEIGWNTDKKMVLDIGSEIEDGVPILTLDFRTVPVRGYGSGY